MAKRRKVRKKEKPKGPSWTQILTGKRAAPAPGRKRPTSAAEKKIAEAKWLEAFSKIFSEAKISGRRVTPEEQKIGELMVGARRLAEAEAERVAGTPGKDSLSGERLALARQQLSVNEDKLLDRINAHALKKKTGVKESRIRYLELLRRRGVVNAKEFEKLEKIIGTRARKGLAVKAFERWEKHFGILRAKAEFNNYWQFLEASEMLNPEELGVLGRVAAAGEKKRLKALEQGLSEEAAEAAAREQRISFLYRLRDRKIINDKQFFRLFPGAKLTGVESRFALYPEDIKDKMIGKLKRSFAELEGRHMFSPASVNRSVRGAFSQAIHDLRDRQGISLKKPLSEKEIRQGLLEARDLVTTWKKDVKTWEQGWSTRGVKGLKGPDRKARERVGVEVDAYLKLMVENPSLQEMADRHKALAPLGGYLPYKQLQIFLLKYWPKAPKGKDLMKMTFLQVMLRGMGSPFGLKRKTGKIEIPLQPSTQELEIRLGRTPEGRKLLKQLKAERYQGKKKAKQS